MYVDRYVILGVVTSFLLLSLTAFGVRELYCWTTQSRFTIINQSGQEVRGLRISVGRDDYRFDLLKPNEKRSAPFTLNHEGGFCLAGSFADGTLIEALNTGYMTTFEDRFGITATVSILPGGRVETTHSSPLY